MSFQDLPDRNNTSFPKELYEVLKQISLAKDDVLKYHQKLLREYFLKYPIRGMLLYHIMGTGKTISCIAICEALLEAGKTSRIMFISNKSLHANFKGSIVKYYEMQNLALPPDWIETKYQFITLNASNMLDQVNAASRGSIAELSELELTATVDDESQKAVKRLAMDDNDIVLDDVTVIHDEWHNMLNSIVNGSKNATGLYEAEMRANNIHIIGLTGTPIINDPYEIALGFNLLAGPIQNGKHTTTLFGEDYQDFTRMFIEHYESLNPDNSDLQRPRMKNKDKFCDRILGLVSYYAANAEEFKREYPLEYNLVVERVPMSHRQYAAYITARDSELEENKRGIFKGVAQRLKKSSSKSSSTYRVKTRQISNFLYPPYASETTKSPTGYSSTKIFIDKLKAESFTASELDIWGRKILKMLHNISIHMPPGVLDEFRPTDKELKHIIALRTKANAKKLGTKDLKAWAPGIGPGIIYSQFLDEGILVIAKALEAHGFEMYDSSKTKSKKPRVAIISGDVPSDIRESIAKIYRDPANQDGKDIMLLLITASGSEGLDLTGRHVHVAEIYWHWARPRQVITRAVRYKSHSHLPLHEQTVQPYIYLSDYPQLESIQDDESGLDVEHMRTELQARIRSEPTTDVTLYYKAVQNQMLIEEFFKALQESSIDCLIHETCDHCRICSPTGRVLWHSDIIKDIELPSPCQPLKTEAVKTKSIKITTPENGTIEYRYTDTDPPHFFEYRKELNAYVEIFAGHKLYETLLSAIPATPAKSKK
jgi:hypothetical protein